MRIMKENKLSKKIERLKKFAGERNLGERRESEKNKTEGDSLPAKKIDEKGASQKGGREKEQNKGTVIAAKNGTKGNDERWAKERAMIKSEIKRERSSYHDGRQKSV